MPGRASPSMRSPSIGVRPGGDDRAALVARAVRNARAVRDDALVQMSSRTDRHIIPQQLRTSTAESPMRRARPDELRAFGLGERERRVEAVAGRSDIEERRVRNVARRRSVDARR